MVVQLPATTAIGANTVSMAAAAVHLSARIFDSLAAQLAAKPALVLRTTKVQVDTASPPVPPESEDVDAEVAGFAAAFSDPECLEAAVAYIERRRR